MRHRVLGQIVDGRTEAEAQLYDDIRDDLIGVGQTRVGPDETDVPEIGDEIAVALTGDRLERLKTAVAETAMNAIEHGNGSDPEVPVRVRVLASGDGLAVEITDRQLTGERTPVRDVLPDLDLKLAGLQPPRGWGLFLVRSMVDEVTERTSADGHTVRLTVRGSDGK